MKPATKGVAFLFIVGSLVSALASTAPSNAADLWRDVTAGAFRPGRRAMIHPQAGPRFIWSCLRKPVTEDGAVDQCYPPSVSPDGRYMICLAVAKDVVPPDDADETLHFYLFDRTTGDISVIQPPFVNAIPDDHTPRAWFGPDGEWVTMTFWVRRGGSFARDVFLYNMVTHTLQPAAATDDDEWDGTVSRGAQAIAFVRRHREEEPSQVVVVDTTGQRISGVISKNADGELGNDDSWGPKISADGRYVAFVSKATNLCSQDTGGHRQVYLFDRQTGELRLVSHDYHGDPVDGDADQPSISADGRYVAFECNASLVVPESPPQVWAVYVYDRVTDTVTLVSAMKPGYEAQYSRWPSISLDGQRVAFSSQGLLDNTCTMCVPLWWQDMDFEWDVYVWDRATRRCRRVSWKSDGTPTQDPATVPLISGDGRWVTFLAWGLDPSAPQFGNPPFLANVDLVPGPQGADLDGDNKVSDTEMAYCMTQLLKAKQGRPWDMWVDTNGDEELTHEDFEAWVEEMLGGE